ncbi:MAG: sigma-70 family RNA polymerase sigma factor, partial [bacterium]|nr:sigma-70 family RNA polymerase sigma factor [bacterium]
TAEEAVHTDFARLLGKPRAPLRLKAYIFRSVRNAASDQWREERAGNDVYLELSSRPGTTATPAVPGENSNLYQALDQLSEDERESIVLKIHQGMTLREIAAIRGVSINTVASWYRRGLEKMRIVLKQDDETRT